MSNRGVLHKKNLSKYAAVLISPDNRHRLSVHRPIFVGLKNTNDENKIT